MFLLLKEAGYKKDNGLYFMIILITYSEINKRTRKKELIVSHGVNPKTNQTVILPNVSPIELGAKYDDKLCEWILIN